MNFKQTFTMDFNESFAVNVGSNKFKINPFIEASDFQVLHAGSAET